MDKIKTTEGDLIVRDARFAIVASRFNGFIVDSLLKGIAALPCGSTGRRMLISRSYGFRARSKCPLPSARSQRRVARTASSRSVASSAVVRRISTTWLANAYAAYRQLHAKHGVPVGFGILTVDTIEQAIERAGTKAGNKGEEATLAVIEMVNLLRRLD